MSEYSPHHFQKEPIHPTEILEVDIGMNQTKKCMKKKFQKLKFLNIFK